MTFDQFLESDEGRRSVCNWHANLMLADLRRHQATIETREDMRDFIEEHRDYFCEMTTEEEKRGRRKVA
jgi:hypothetical protein